MVPKGVPLEEVVAEIFDGSGGVQDLARAVVRSAYFNQFLAELGRLAPADALSTLTLVELGRLAPADALTALIDLFKETGIDEKLAGFLKKLLEVDWVRDFFKEQLVSGKVAYRDGVLIINA